MTSKNDITQEYLKECFDYDPETGILTWKERPSHHFGSEGFTKSWNSRYSGRVAGSKLDSNGCKPYIYIRIKACGYLAHRVIWKIITGEWPDNQIDHQDGNGTNNKWTNFREATPIENGRNRRLQSNNQSGVIGVSLRRKENKWCASIGVNNKTIVLGGYKSKQAAIIRRQAAELEYGFHHRHGEDRPL